MGGGGGGDLQKREESRGREEEVLSVKERRGQTIKCVQSESINNRSCWLSRVHPSSMGRFRIVQYHTHCKEQFKLKHIIC